MKIIWLLIFFWFITGCAAPLNKATTSQYIASTERLEEAEVKQVDYCSFVVTAKESHIGTWKECILGITEKSIYFYTGKLSDDNLQQAMKISFSDVKGVDLSKFFKTSEIYLLLEDRVVGLYITKDRARIDVNAVKSLYNELLTKGIPIFEFNGLIRNTGVFIVY